MGVVEYRTKGQRPYSLVEQMCAMFLMGAAHCNLLPVLTNILKPYADFTPIGRSF